MFQDRHESCRYKKAHLLAFWHLIPSWLFFANNSLTLLLRLNLSQDEEGVRLDSTRRAACCTAAVHVRPIF